MRYDPVKKYLGKIFDRYPWLRVVLYRILELLLLRSWYVRRELKKWGKTAEEYSTVLDAGSGYGQYCWRLSKLEKNIWVFGMDLKQDQMTDCSLFFMDIGLADRVFSVARDITKLDEVEQYDLIMTVDVLEHIEDDELVLKNLHRAMIKDGVLIVSTPSDKGGSDTYRHKCGQVTGFVEEHFRDGYNKEELEEKLKRIGFEITKSIYTYGIPGRISWIFSVKYPILMLNASKKFIFFLPFYYLVTYPFCFVLNCLDVLFKHKKGTGLFIVGKKN